MKKIFANGISIAIVLVAATLSNAQDGSVEISAELKSIFKDGTPSSIDQLKAMQEHIIKVTKKVMPSVVGVQVGAASGSGVIISEDGYVLTAGHVVQTPNKVCRIILTDGTVLPGKTLGMQTSRDSGLMKITKKGKYPFLDMGVSKDVEKGQWIFALGHPGGFDPKRTPPLRVGRVNGKSRTTGMLQTDCVLVGGDSGGPLFDMAGKVIGIHSRINSSTRDGQFVGNFHVPVDIYGETWDQLAAGENIGAPKSTRSSSSKISFGFKIDTDKIKPTIKAVEKDLPSDKAGMKVGDVIVSVNGKRVFQAEGLRTILGSVNKGDKVKIVVKRDGKDVELTVELKEAESKEKTK